MTLGDTFLSTIDTRAFSSLWYWIVLFAVWGYITYRPLGVPFDLVMRANRVEGAVPSEFETFVHVFVGRRLHFVDRYALFLIGILGFALSSLIILAMFYGSELALAVLLLLIPALLCWWISHRAAKRIDQGEITGSELVGALSALRIKLQFIAFASIFVTSLIGAFFNLTRSFAF